VDDHVRAVDERPCGDFVANVAPDLLDGCLELAIVMRREVERPHEVALADEPACQMQAEKACAARDRDAHQSDVVVNE
jgi:hypothetical protein